MLYLMRHAQTISEVRGTSIKADNDLSTLGHNQAHKAGEWLRDKGITAIYTSPAPHAQRSATIIGDVLGITPQIDHDLIDIQSNPESDAVLKEAVNRLSALLTRIQNETRDSLIVTHGELLAKVIPLMCINAAALQRVKAPLDTGFIILEPFTIGRYICQSWDLREHLNN